MKFKLHRSIRWGLSPISDGAYFLTIADYYGHLSRLNFSGNMALLRYFGDSFFHDAQVAVARWNRRAAALELQIFTLNDLEDINAYRKRNQLAPISRSRYLSNPVTYMCRFSGVRSMRGPLSLLRNRRTPVVILDTEIDRTERRGDLVVRISIGRNREISFTCRGCSVRLGNRRRIRAYTGGLRAQLPRCALCRSKLLTPGKILQTLRLVECYRAQAPKGTGKVPDKKYRNPLGS